MGALVTSHPQVPRSQDPNPATPSSGWSTTLSIAEEKTAFPLKLYKTCICFHTVSECGRTEGHPQVTVQLSLEASLWSQHILPPLNKSSRQNNLLHWEEWQPPYSREANEPYPNPFLLGCQPTSILLAFLHQLLHSSPVCVSYPQSTIFFYFSIVDA